NEPRGGDRSHQPRTFETARLLRRDGVGRALRRARVGAAADVAPRIVARSLQHSADAQGAARRRRRARTIRTRRAVARRDCPPQRALSRPTMPQPSRRARIEAMLADDPADAFLRYSLAMELDKEGENERSLEILRSLMADVPPYVAAFFMAGQQLTRLQRIEE